jgi:hypothetical protein
VQDVPDSHSRIDIQYVGVLRIGGPRFRVFIDREWVGELKPPNHRLQACFVTPGSHSISVRNIVWRSQTVDVNLAPGETAALECGFERPRAVAYAFWAVAWIASFPLNMAGLPLTGFAATLLGLLGLGYVSWRQWTTPGGYLFLRPRAEQQLPEFLRREAEQESPVTTGRLARRLPRITIRQLMLFVAVLGVLFAVAAHEHRMQRQSKIEAEQRLYRVKQDGFRARAETEADSERFWKRMEAHAADGEALALKRIETLSELTRLEAERESWNTELDKAKRSLAAQRANRANAAQHAETATRLKKKFMEAAERQWEAAAVTSDGSDDP